MNLTDEYSGLCLTSQIKIPKDNNNEIKVFTLE